jgi:hypothetical protein
MPLPEKAAAPAPAAAAVAPVVSMIQLFLVGEVGEEWGGRADKKEKEKGGLGWPMGCACRYKDLENTIGPKTGGLLDFVGLTPPLGLISEPLRESSSPADSGSPNNRISNRVS